VNAPRSAAPEGDAAGIGVFGKLPARGDFVDRGVAPGFSEVWYGWLVQGLAQARAKLGPNFDAAYMSAPVWRFLLPAGAAGPCQAHGVIVPSIDAAERLFPLTLACWHTSPRDPLALLEAGAWFEALEQQARAALALEQGVPGTFEGWLDILDDLRPPALATCLPFADPWRILPVDDEDVLGALMRPLARSAATHRTILWSAGSPHVRPAAWVGEGLPGGADFPMLLADGVQHEEHAR
jgi:type VI secretion system protein ImpM